MYDHNEMAITIDIVVRAALYLIAKSESDELLSMMRAQEKL